MYVCEIVFLFCVDSFPKLFSLFPLVLFFIWVLSLCEPVLFCQTGNFWRTSLERTEISHFVCEADFVVHTHLTLLQGEAVEMEVDQFACRHSDVPLAVGFVAVAARITHRGYGTSCASQVLWPSTTRCYKRRTEGENKQRTLNLSHVDFGSKVSV